MKTCACGRHIPSRIKIGGKEHNLKNRTRCLECVPFKTPRTRKSRNNRARYKAWYIQEKQRLGRDPIGLRRAQRKDFLVRLLGAKCQFCPYDRHVGNLSFHHLDPEEKSNQIGCQYKLERVLDELRKCVMSCHNCHGEIHAGLISLGQVQLANAALLELIANLVGTTWADHGLDYPYAGYDRPQ